MGNENKIPIRFPVTVFNNIEESGVITKARVRIFYKYANRNGTYITDEFADKLLATLPGSPIKGIYNEFTEDYEDHGKKRTDGRAYGFVPETNHNIAYEEHLDEDGVLRTYACADVFLWTALYDEANDIINTPQSMELYPPSVKGEWKKNEAGRYFVYTEGSFLGLQALGKDVEPCFEGAAFFALFNSYPKEFIQTLYNSFLEFQNKSQDNNGGEKDMDKTDFKLSDKQKGNKIFQALNTEGGMRYWVHDTYDDHAIVFDYETETYGKVSYSKNDKDNTVSIEGEVEPVFVEYLTKEEQVSLEAIKAIKGTFTESLKEFNAQNTKIKESDETISTLNTDKVEIEAKLEVATLTIANLEKEKSELVEFKVNKELAEKEDVLTKYSEKLDETIIEKYRAELGQYTVLELEKELSYTLVTTDPTVFSHNGEAFVPKEQPIDGIVSVLSKYKK